MLDLNFGEGLTDDERTFLLPLDPSFDDLKFLWALQLLLNSATVAANGGDGDIHGELVEHSAQFAVQQEGFQIELLGLHRLALRRLADPPPEAAHLLESWRHEEEALFAVLERIQELRREQRAAVLSQ